MHKIGVKYIFLFVFLSILASSLTGNDSDDSKVCGRVRVGYVPIVKTGIKTPDGTGSAVAMAAPRN